MHTNFVVIWRIGNWKIDLKKREKEEVKETKIDNHSNLVKNLFEKEFTQSYILLYLIDDSLYLMYDIVS